MSVIDVGQPDKNPWELNWSGEKDSTPPVSSIQGTQAQEPWNMDWGIQDYIGALQQAYAGLKNDSSVLNNMWKAESNSQHTDAQGNLITSSAGARGITQLMPATAKNPGFGIEPVKDDSEEEYMRVGSSLALALKKKYGNWRMAVAAYNAGTGNVDRALKRAQENGGDFTKYLPKPQETIPYMDKILGTVDGRFNAS